MQLTVKRKCSFLAGLFSIRSLVIMKMAVIILLITCFQASGDVNAQQISLKEQNVSLKKVFRQIEQQTDYLFIYRNEWLRNANKVDINLKDASIEEVMAQCLAGQSLTYTIVDNNIVIHETSSAQRIKAIPVLTDIQVSGVITDSTNARPLAGVTVRVQGSTLGTTTDAEGKFNLSVPDGAVLIVSYLGYGSKTVLVNGRSTINISLAPSATGLEQLVVVGYGTQKAKDISGAITVLTGDDFNKGVTQTAADLLQGKVAGLVITTDGGDVTADKTMRLRGVSSLTGSSSPFVVIDGVPGMDINSVSPQDIASISILKDASAAAIYGSRSASGVILITTKKGKAGETNVHYNGYVAVDFLANKPRVLTASEWRDYTKKEGMDVSGLDKGGYTDWFDAITRTGISQNHNISISGGGPKSSYRGSLNYLDRQGIMRDNQLDRYNILFSMNQKALNDRLDLSFTGGSVLSDYSPTNVENATLAYQMLPVYPVKNPDGSWFTIFQNGLGNPVHNIAENKDLYKTSSLFANMKADLVIFKGFTAGLNLFKQRKTSDHSVYNAMSTPAGRGDNGYAYRGNQVWDKNLLEFTSKYSTLIGKHSLSMLAGYSYEDDYWQQESAQNRGFITDIFGYNNLSAGENLFSGDVNSDKNMSKLISYFGRLNYSFDDKYIFTGTIRRDGSSKFGKDNKWGSFPSASVAWRISGESFMSNVEFVNNLKLRISYGTIGNQDGIGPYNSIALYGRSDEYWDNGRWNNSYRYSQNANSQLKWEQTSSSDFGLDYSLFNDRLYGSIDYYNKKTNNLLYTYNVPVPPNLYPTILANVGDMSNKGFEVSINWDIIRSEDLRWSASLNVAHNKNTITRLSNDIYSTSSIKIGEVDLAGTTGIPTHIVEVGREVGTFYGLQYVGLDSSGSYIIKDLNDDGDINGSDRTYIGHALPDLTYGISNAISYKSFDFSFFLRGVHGNDVLNSPSLRYGNKQWLPGINVLKEALSNGINDAPKYSSYYIEKGTFLRLDNMSLAYNFSPRNELGIRNCKFYITAQNLFVITKYKGLDPEVTMNGLNPGIEEDFYVPKARTFSFGVNIDF